MGIIHTKHDGQITAVYQSVKLQFYYDFLHGLDFISLVIRSVCGTRTDMNGMGYAAWILIKTRYGVWASLLKR